MKAGLHLLGMALLLAATPAVQEAPSALAAAAELLARGETPPAAERLRSWAGEVQGDLAGERWLAATQLLLAYREHAVAEEFAARSRELLPDRYEPFAFLGTCYLVGHQVDRALAHFQEGLRLFPEEADVYFQLGMAYSQQQRLGDAAEMFRQALARDGRQPIYHFWAGDLEAKLGRFAAAEAHFQTALGNPQVGGDAAWKLAEVQGLRGRDREAEETFRRALSGGSALSRRRAALHYGVFLFERGRHAEAAAQLTAVVHGTADSRVAWYYLARAQRELGQAADAQQSLLRYRALQRSEDALENEMFLEQIAALRGAAPK